MTACPIRKQFTLKVKLRFWFPVSWLYILVNRLRRAALFPAEKSNDTVTYQCTSGFLACYPIPDNLFEQSLLLLCILDSSGSVLTVTYEAWLPTSPLHFKRAGAAAGVDARRAPLLSLECSYHSSPLCCQAHWECWRIQRNSFSVYLHTGTSKSAHQL